jgi:hypothetical protein
MGPEGIILENHPYVSLIGRDRGYRLPVEVNLTVIRLVKSPYQSKNGCFPTTRRTEKCEKFSVMDLQ